MAGESKEVPSSEHVFFCPLLPKINHAQYDGRVRETSQNVKLKSCGGFIRCWLVICALLQARRVSADGQVVLNIGAHVPERTKNLKSFALDFPSSFAIHHPPMNS
jgi:hypothetical protein